MAGIQRDRSRRENASVPFYLLFGTRIARVLSDMIGAGWCSEVKLSGRSFVYIVTEIDAQRQQIKRKGSVDEGDGK
jgi:hypothetical protein